MGSIVSDVDRFCPLPISGLTVFLRSRAMRICLRVSDPIKAAFGRVAGPQFEVEAQALFHACLFHNLGVRKSAEALPANDVVYLQVSMGELTARFAARAAFLSPLEGVAAPMTDSTAARRSAALLQFNSFCGSRIANLNACASSSAA